MPTRAEIRKMLGMNGMGGGRIDKMNIPENPTVQDEKTESINEEDEYDNDDANKQTNTLDKIGVKIVSINEKIPAFKDNNTALLVLIPENDIFFKSLFLVQPHEKYETSFLKHIQDNYLYVFKDGYKGYEKFLDLYNNAK